MEGGLKPVRDPFKALEDFRVKVRSNRASHHTHRLALLQVLPVGPVGGEGVKGICYRYDPRRERYLAGLEPLGVTGAVEVLVVVADPVGDLPEPVYMTYHPGAYLGVLAHLAHRLVVESPRLVEYLLGNTYLSRVMEKGRELYP